LPPTAFQGARVLVLAGACYWHGVGGFVLNYKSAHEKCRAGIPAFFAHRSASSSQRGDMHEILGAGLGILRLDLDEVR